jgi:hypothetical protein
MLVGHWPLIGNTNDYSGYNNNGTPTSITYTAGRIGQAASFNGTNSMVDLGNPSALSSIGGTTNISVSAWVFYTAFGGGGQTYSVITVKGGTPWTWLMENPSNTFRFRISAGGTDTNISDTSAHLLNRWYHVVGTYDGATMKIYVDGVLKNSKAQTGALGSNSTTAKIGTFQGTNYNFTGRINDVRVYNHTLSDFEIKELAKAKVTHLTLNGTTIDNAGYGYNGTPQASTSYTTDSKLYSQAFQNTDGGGSKAITIANGTQNITGDQTIAMWLFPTSFAARRNPWNKAYGGEGTITQETGGTLTYFWGTHGGDNVPYQGFASGGLTLNTWNHVVLVRDLSASTPQLRWYINGVLSTVATPSYTAAAATTNGTTIAAGYTSPYQGRISDVRQYGTALSATDVLALYNRRASFDNAGNIHIGEYIEIDDNATMGVNSLGQVLYESLSTVGIADDALKAFWPLTENSEDFTINGFNLTAVNSPTVSFADGYSFNGTNQYLTIAHTTELNPGTGNFTYSFMFRSPTLRAGQVFGKRSTANIEMQLANDGTMYTYMANTAGTTSAITITNAYTANTWHHYSVTRNGTAAIVYIDGVQRGTATLPAGLDISPTSAFEIGRDPGNGVEYFQGNVKIFKYFTRALSAAEVAIESDIQSKSNKKVIIQKDGEAFIQGTLYEGL